MLNLILLFIAAALVPSMVLRKINLTTTALGNNGDSFVNATGDKIHILETRLKLTLGPNAALGDVATASLDEIPVAQDTVADSRSHISGVRASVSGATGATESDQVVETQVFERGDLTLDLDHALFLNTTDIDGAPPIAASCLIFYED